MVELYTIGGQHRHTQSEASYLPPSVIMLLSIKLLAPQIRMQAIDTVQHISNKTYLYVSYFLCTVGVHPIIIIQYYTW